MPRKWSGRPKGDYPALCSCGVPWPRSKLVRKADGLFYCPDCNVGDDAVTCNRLNVEMAPKPGPRPPMDAPVEPEGDYSAADYVRGPIP